MVSAFIAGQPESSLFSVLEELARARCRRVTSMHTQPSASEPGPADQAHAGLAYDLYDSPKVLLDGEADKAAKGVQCTP